MVAAQEGGVKELYLRMTREFTISNGNNKFSVRFGRYFFYVLLICAVILGAGAIRQTTDYNLIAVGVLIIGTAFCLYKSMNTLYKVVFDLDSRQVTVDILQFDKIKHRHVVPFEVFEAIVKTDYLQRGIPSALRIYANGKLLFKQGQSHDWTLEKLYDVEDYAKEFLR